jgi:hypothetical protein
MAQEIWCGTYKLDVVPVHLENLSNALRKSSIVTAAEGLLGHIRQIPEILDQIDAFGVCSGENLLLPSARSTLTGRFPMTNPCSLNLVKTVSASSSVWRSND